MSSIDVIIVYLTINSVDVFLSLAATSRLPGHTHLYAKNITKAAQRQRCSIHTSSSNARALVFISFRIGAIIIITLYNYMLN